MHLMCTRWVTVHCPRERPGITGGSFAYRQTTTNSRTPVVQGFPLSWENTNVGITALDLRPRNPGFRNEVWGMLKGVGHTNSLDPRRALSTTDKPARGTRGYSNGVEETVGKFPLKISPG